LIFTLPQLYISGYQKKYRETILKQENQKTVGRGGGGIIKELKRGVVERKIGSEQKTSYQLPPSMEE
jgi:hypothetical protein